MTDARTASPSPIGLKLSSSREEKVKRQIPVIAIIKPRKNPLGNFLLVPKRRSTRPVKKGTEAIITPTLAAFE